MNKFTLIFSSFLTVSMVTPSTTYGTLNGDGISDGLYECTRTNPCYYENGHWHALDNEAEVSWTSYEIATLTATLGMTIFMPLVHNAISRFLDYAAYKWYFWRGLKDTGQDLQTVQLTQLARSSQESENILRRIATANENNNLRLGRIIDLLGEQLGNNQQNPQGAALPQPD